MKTAFLKYTILLLILGPIALAESGWYPVPERAYNLSYFLAVAMTWLFLFTSVTTVAFGEWIKMKPGKFPTSTSFVMMFFASLGWYWLASAWAVIFAVLSFIYLVQQSEKTAKEVA